MDQKVEIEMEASVSGLFRRPEESRALLLLAHGAGAGMEHRHMVALTEEMARRQIATLRYQFPYMEAGKRRPDRAPRLHETVRAANRKAAELAPDLPRIAGGRSMGGRMTTGAQAEAPLDGVRGIVLFAFPLHPAGKPGTKRADHLNRVEVPMLFLNGDRDKLADLDLLRPVCEKLGPRARLHVLEGADHGFHVLKRSGRTDEEVLVEAGAVVEEWLNSIL